jgi:hypothetical protein
MSDTNKEAGSAKPGEGAEGQGKDQTTQQTQPTREPVVGQPPKEPQQKPKRRGAGGPDETADIFLKRKLYPDAAGIFAFQPKTLEQIKADCRFVLDTNELLLPYKIGSHDLEEIGKVYRRLLGEKRLFVPGQVAREFAANRSEHIKNLAHALAELKRAFKPTFHHYPLLDGLDEYKALAKQWETTQALLLIRR